MFTILKKELFNFFIAPIGYIFIFVFSLISTLILWFFDTPFNIPNSGFASISPFFETTPWLLLLIIPSICMVSFSKEHQQGTLELLLTRPISTIDLILGKFLGVAIVVLTAILPSIVHVIAICDLSDESIDFGEIISGYIALLLLSKSFICISLWISAWNKNETTSFLISVFSCFILYYGLENLSIITQNAFIEKLGMRYHYVRINEGVLDTRDISYFLALSGIFTMLNYFLLRKKHLPIATKTLSTLGIASLLTIGFSQNKYYRFDLTKDQRFTLSETSLESIYQIEEPIIIDILLDGDLPIEFRKLQRETKQLLSSFSSENSNIKFIFSDPIGEKKYKDQAIAQLQEQGISPLEVSTQYEGKLKKEVVVPWAIIYKNKKNIRVPLIKHTLGETSEERITNSIAQLEYTFATAFRQLNKEKAKKIAILKGNRQLEDLYLSDFIKSVRKFYKIAPFFLDTITPNKTLNELREYDLVINAKPRHKFSDIQKQLLDQHLMSNKQQMWLIDRVIAEKDSIFSRPSATTLTWDQQLNIDDLLFSYGIRIRPQLIKDYYSDPIILAKGQGNNSQYTPYFWGYAPLSESHLSHPITNTLNKVRFNFASPIDTLKNKTTKQILLKTSGLTELKGVPATLSLQSIIRTPKKEQFTKGVQNLAVLLENDFKSTYQNRILPFEQKDYKDHTDKAKLLIVSDGDIIKNEIHKGQAVPLGVDPITQKNFANKDFLINTVNYMLNDEGLLTLRNKQLHIAFLNLEKLSQEKVKWQYLCIGIPVVLLSLFFGMISYLRKRYNTV